MEIKRIDNEIINEYPKMNEFNKLVLYRDSDFYFRCGLGIFLLLLCYRKNI